MRRNPWPFEDEEFDFIMLKDLSLVVPLGGASQRFLDECIRLLKVGGTLEIWESDHVLRSLLPHPPPPPNIKNRADNDMAVSTGTFLIGPGTPFAPAQNKYITHANTWIGEALDRRKLPPMPCARVANILFQEPERGWYSTRCYPSRLITVGARCIKAGPWRRGFSGRDWQGQESRAQSVAGPGGFETDCALECRADDREFGAVIERGQWQELGRMGRLVDVDDGGFDGPQPRCDQWRVP
jgi:hypothetical protein